MTTGEQWNRILREMMVEAPACILNPHTYLLSDCGSTSWAILILLSFELIVTLMMMNLFVVTVINNFDSSTQDTSYSLVTMEDLTIFKKAWAEFDPNGTGYIQKKHLQNFFRASFMVELALINF